jgi:hypothetical protein
MRQLSAAAVERRISLAPAPLANVHSHVSRPASKQTLNRQWKEARRPDDKFYLGYRFELREGVDVMSAAIGRCVSVSAFTRSGEYPAVLVEPMKGEGIFELYHREAEAAEQRRKPEPTKTVYAPGSMEWLAEQKKSG